MEDSVQRGKVRRACRRSGFSLASVRELLPDATFHPTPGFAARPLMPVTPAQSVVRQ